MAGVVGTRNINQFITLWDTRNTSAGSSNSNQISLPLQSFHGSYDFRVYWGDDSYDDITSWNQSEATHTYVVEGIYRIIIIGVIDTISFGASVFSDKLKLLDISNWGTFNWNGNTLAGSNFSGCTNFNISAKDAPGNIKTMSYAFNGCSSLNAPLNHWDVSQVQSFNSTFFNASIFNQDLDKWDVSLATDMYFMFNGAWLFNGNITAWDVSNVTRMHATLYRTSFDQDISNWNIVNVNNFNAFSVTNNLSTTNYDKILIGWEAILQAAYPGGVGYLLSPSPAFGTAKYTAGGAAEAARTSLTNNFNWNITDGGSV